MRPAFKIALLTALVAISASLTIVLVGLRPVGAQSGSLFPSNWTYWVAEDGPKAIGALSQTGTFTYQDRVKLPGRVGDASAKVKVKGVGTSPGPKLLDGALAYENGQWSHRQEGALAYTAKVPLSPAYEVQNSVPVKLWTPMLEGKTNVATAGESTGLPAIKVVGKGGTVFSLIPEPGKPKSDTTTSFKTTDRIGTSLSSLRPPATKFGVSIKWENNRAKIATTGPQLRAFVKQLQDAKRAGRGEAAMLFTGSLNDDRLAAFLWLARVRNEQAELKIGIIPTR